MAAINRKPGSDVMIGAVNSQNMEVMSGGKNCLDFYLFLYFFNIFLLILFVLHHLCILSIYCVVESTVDV